MGTVLHHFVRKQGGTILSMLPVLRNRLGRCLCMPDRPLCFFPCFGQRNDAHQHFWKTYQTPQRDKMKPASHSIVGARQGNLFGKSSAANPSESIWNHITSHLKHMLSTSEPSTLSPFNAVAIYLVYLYLVQSNPTHTIGLQLNHQWGECF